MCPTFPFPSLGGGHKRAVRLIEAMERAGANPLLITDDPAAAEGRHAAEERGWSVRAVPEAPPGIPSRLRQHLGRWPSPPSPGILRELDIAVREGPAFVQFEDRRGLTYAGRTRATPAVLSTYNVESQVLADRAREGSALSYRGVRLAYQTARLRNAERRAAAAVEATLAVSERDHAYFAHLCPEVLLTANGVDAELFDLPADAGELDVVLFFGQLRYGPNADGLARFLREAWPLVAERRPAAELRVAGAGASASLTEAAAAAPRVRMLGFVDDLRQELERAQLTVAPIWRGGGTRIKVLESLAAALPVVGTEVAVEQIGFRGGEHGLVADDPAGLAAAVVSMLGDDGQRQAMAAGGRRLARDYEWRATLRPAELLYRRLLENARSGV